MNILVEPKDVLMALHLMVQNDVIDFRVQDDRGGTGTYLITFEEGPYKLTNAGRDMLTRLKRHLRHLNAEVTT